MNVSYIRTSNSENFYCKSHLCQSEPIISNKNEFRPQQISTRITKSPNQTRSAQFKSINKSRLVNIINCFARHSRFRDRLKQQSSSDEQSRISCETLTPAAQIVVREVDCNNVQTIYKSVTLKVVNEMRTHSSRSSRDSIVISVVCFNSSHSPWQ